MKKIKEFINNYSHILLLISLIVPLNTATASQRQTDDLTLIGQGEMSWLFIDLYQASLYSPSGQYNKNVYPQALNITYQKNIDKKHLLDATEKEWDKLLINKNLTAYWLTSLQKIWPDIKSGDELLFIAENNGKGLFYHNDLLVGAINSKQFPEAFLSIWLSEETSEPALRKQLLGE